jgi:hypothetical protein
MNDINKGDLVQCIKDLRDRMENKELKAPNIGDICYCSFTAIINDIRSGYIPLLYISLDGFGEQGFRADYFKKIDQFNIATKQQDLICNKNYSMEGVIK